MAGRYLINEIIGRGGRAVVYGATDPLLGREVAVKIFHESAASPAEVKLQGAEARLIAQMNHHALTTLFDAGVDDTDPARPRIYLVMERIPGLDLKAHTALHGPLTAAQVAYLGFDLAEGLRYLHEYGFLHRDIKPGNVLLAERRISTRIRGKLSDFGIASIIGVRERGLGVSGTAAYISPEQAEGRMATTASDVYALGLVLLEALTGRLAFPGTVERSIAARLERDPAVPDEISKVLAGVLRAMTARRPEARPGVEEVILAFEDAFVNDLATKRRDRHGVGDNDVQRISEATRGYILDTPPHDALDRITRLVCRLLRVPIALVSVVDAHPERHTARRVSNLGELDRSFALFELALAKRGPFAVRDVQTQPEFQDNPIVMADPSLHAFASVPLELGGDDVVGTLCIFDRSFRTFSQQEMRDLKDLAEMAVHELELRTEGPQGPLLFS